MFDSVTSLTNDSLIDRDIKLSISATIPNAIKSLTTSSIDSD